MIWIRVAAQAGTFAIALFSFSPEISAQTAKDAFLRTYRDFVNTVNIASGSRDIASIRAKFPDMGTRLSTAGLPPKDAAWCEAALSSIRNVALDLQQGKSTALNRKMWLDADPKCDPASIGQSPFRMR
jgi:hypothetical protein